MKKIMILGASILQLPAIQKAKDMGIKVIAVDKDKNAIGFRYADVCCEISTTDIPGVVEAARKYDIDGIMTLASDLPMRTVAAVAKDMNIIGISEDTALKATNKAIMRECLKSHHIPVPRFYKVSSNSEYLNAVRQFENRCIVKPSDNSGSRGVFLINDINDINLVKYAFDYSKKHSRSGELVVEEFMEGMEVSVETLSFDDKVHIIAITDKLTTGTPNFVEMGHSQPSCLSKEIKENIKEVAAAAVRAIGIEIGPSHTEIIVTDEGAKIVEIGARLGGDNIATHLVPMSTGVDMVKCCIELALGYKPDIVKKYEKASAIRYFNTYKGKIADIKNVDAAERSSEIKQISFVKNTGDTIESINCSTDRVGFIIAQSEIAEKAIRSCEKAISMIAIQIV